MSQNIIINGNISDEYGGDYPNSIAVLWAFSETTKTTGISEPVEGAVFDISSDTKATTYKVSYWYNSQTKAIGKRSRPLTNDDEVTGVFTDVFTADIDTQAVIDILESNVGHVEKILRIIESDAKRRFS